MNIINRGHNTVVYHGQYLHYFEEYSKIKQEQRAAGIYRSASYNNLLNLRYGSPDLIAIDSWRDWLEWIFYGGTNYAPTARDIRRAAEKIIFENGKQDVRPDSEYIIEDDPDERRAPLED